MSKRVIRDGRLVTMNAEEESQWAADVLARKTALEAEKASREAAKRAKAAKLSDLKGNESLPELRAIVQGLIEEIRGA